MSASDIPVRINGQEIVAGWFNDIRTYLVGSSGTEGSEQVNFSGIASQTNTDVTGLVFDKLITESATVEFTINTSDGDFEKSTLDIWYDGTIWNMSQGAVSGDDSLVTLDIDTTTGQVDYTNAAFTFTMKFRAVALDI